jgi:L-methionine (R)-S-oxide reductase
MHRRRTALPGRARLTFQLNVLEESDGMHAPNDLTRADKASAYAELEQSLRALLAGESDLVACAANTAALLYWSLPQLNWAGFYLVEPSSGDLLLGPFQGRPACVRIAIGKGVCGTAAARLETVVVEDVHAFPGHIACDSASNSEVVVPIVDGARLIGVLDLDSPVHGRFDDVDARGLEALVRAFVAATRRVVG